MNIAERLAREIRRVTGLRHGDFTVDARRNSILTLVDAALEEGCLAIGSGDVVRMEAAGLQLQAIER